MAVGLMRALDGDERWVCRFLSCVDLGIVASLLNDGCQLGRLNPGLLYSGGYSCGCFYLLRHLKPLHGLTRHLESKMHRCSVVLVRNGQVPSSIS